MASPNKNKIYNSIKNNYTEFTNAQSRFENTLISNYKGFYDFLHLLKVRQIPVKKKIMKFFSIVYLKIITLNSFVTSKIKEILQKCFRIFK